MRHDGSVLIPTKKPPRAACSYASHRLRTVDIDLEVIVVDDGSEGTACNVVTARGDPRVRLLRNPISQGVSMARNRGLSAASGRWVALCDDDDLWAPDKLLMQVKEAQRAGRAWVYAGAVKIDSELRVVGGEPPPPRRRPPPTARMDVDTWWLFWCYGPRRARAGGRRIRPGTGQPGRLGPLEPPGRGGPAGVRAASADRLPDPQWQLLKDTSLVLRELDLLDGRYGARVDRAAVHHYLAWVSLRGGRRRQAARHFLRAAVRGDYWGVARSLSALVLRRLPGVHIGPRHTAWREQAEQWLEPLR